MLMSLKDEQQTAQWRRNIIAISHCEQYENYKRAMEEYIFSLAGTLEKETIEAMINMLYLPITLIENKE